MVFAKDDITEDYFDIIARGGARAQGKCPAQMGMIRGLIASSFLIVRIVVGAQIGSDRVGFKSLSPTEFNRLAGGHATQVQLLVRLNNMFVVSYLVAFVGLACVAWDRRALALLGLGSSKGPAS